MKKIAFQYYFLSILLAFGAIACEDELDLKPAQEISEDLALNTDSNVKAVLVGAYDQLANGDIFGGNTLRNAELIAGDQELLWVGTFEAPRDIFNKAITVTNGDVEEVWLESYETINIANNVLSALSVVNEDDRPTVEGEALFIRALAYFELVRFYAKQYEAATAATIPGVPVVLTPTRGITTQNQVPRNTVEQVYAQIIGDLIKAETQLPADNEWRANKEASAALLARIYLQKGDYASARDAANRVITSGNYMLLPKYEDLFNREENSNEDIFAIQVTTQDGVNNMHTFFSIPEFGARDGDIEILEAHLDLYDATDERLSLFYEGSGATRSGKWNNIAGNITLIRLAEMYLIRAETNLRLSTSVGATPLQDYNTIRARARLSAATNVTLEEILLERRRELAHEGFRIHDIKRTKGTVGGTLPYNADKLLFPIPNREIVANPNLTQNSGY